MRSTVGRIVPGSAATVASVQSRLDDFEAVSASLDDKNLRDGAIDSAHLSTGLIMKSLTEGAIGEADPTHTAYGVGGTGLPSVPSWTTAPFNGTVVSTAGGTATVLSMGSAGKTISATQCLRVYWNLNVKPKYAASPWNDVVGGTGALGRYNVTSSAGFNIVTYSHHCWIAWLEWDTTSNALSNWVTVPGQDRPTTNLGGGYTGIKCSRTMATTLIPAWSVWRSSVDQGVDPGSEQDTSRKWLGIEGSHWDIPVGTTTVYGLRVVLGGLVHPYYSTTLSEDCLAVDPIVGGNSQVLLHTGGRIVATVMEIE